MINNTIRDCLASIYLPLRFVSSKKRRIFGIDYDIRSIAIQSYPLIINN